MSHASSRNEEHSGIALKLEFKLDRCKILTLDPTSKFVAVKKLKNIIIE